MIDHSLVEKQEEIDSLKKQLEHEKKSIDQRIKDAQSFYEELIALLPGHVYWLNKNNEFLGCNNQQAYAAGFASRQEIVGRKNENMPWRDQADEINRINSEVIKTGKSIIREEYAVTAQGAGYYLSHKVPLKNDKNEIIGLLGVSLDISKRKELEDNLREAKALAEQADQAKSEFLSNMRHDIRTPLSGIIGFSEILKSESSEPRIKEYADNLIASSHALLHLMDEVLEAVRVSSGEIPLLKRKFNLANVFEQIISLYKAKAEEKHLKLHLELDPKLPGFVIGDKIRLHRIVLELLSNALNFTDKGHVDVHVHLAKKDKRYLVIKLSVLDTGIGIEKEKQQEIYLQFKRLTPSYQGIYKGSGLGLYVVKQFIDDMEGEIYVESAPQKGSCFVCLLPLQEALLDDDSGVEQDDQIIIDEKHTLRTTVKINPGEFQSADITDDITEKNSHVLVVEDNGIAQMAAKVILTSMQCQVDVASDGITALALCKANNYDLIFMDIGLGEGMDGYEVTKQIRNLSYQYKNTPIIALTAHGGDENKQRCIEAGMDAVLTKPLTQIHASDIIQNFIPSRKPAPQPKTSLNRLDLPDDDNELFCLAQFALLDSDQALENCGGQDMLVELLTMMVQKDLPADLTRMKEAYAAKDYGQVEKIAHKIKGGAVYVGTTRMKYACQYLERYWKAGERELFDALYQQALTTIDETCGYVVQWLGRQ